MASISFWGATGTVTGSKYLIDAGPRLDDRLLVDCGMFQGLKELRLRNWSGLPESPQSIGSVVLTHAHIDHSGYLPRIVRGGFAGPIHGSRSTTRLLEYLLPDSAHLQEEEAAYANRKGYSKHKPAQPLYTSADAARTLTQLRDHPMHEWFAVSENLSARYRYAGHILGAAHVELKIRTREGEVHVLFSGDLGRYGVPLMPDPEPAPAVDYLIVESTYGDRDHPPREPQEELETVVNESLDRGGVLIIPAFAVGRTQMILHDIRLLEEQERIPSVPVYLDSPMASMVTRLQNERVEDLDAEARELFRQNPQRLLPRKIHFVGDRHESMALNNIRGNAIIISASGMLTGGRVLHHARQRLPQGRNTILFVGYQARGTRGRHLLEGAETIKMFGEHVPVQAQIRSIAGYSAHADRSGILAWLKTFPKPPRRTFIVHGEEHASQALASTIGKELGWNVTIPEYTQTFPLEPADAGS
jgi:metallo-beta-lactamase family protein